MELNEIMAISGAPGLYKFVAQGKNGVIVESLTDGRRMMVGGTARVSTLGDMAIFTDAKELPLDQVLQQIYDKNAGKAVKIDGKSSPAELAKFMQSAVPNYDRERVHNSDIKKLAQWYNTLVGAGMTSFRSASDQTQNETQGEGSTEQKTATKTTPKTAKATSAASAAASKKAAPPKASGAKAPTMRSTTARKAQ